MASGHGVEMLGMVKENDESRYGNELMVEAIRFEGDKDRFSEIDLSKKEIHVSPTFEQDHAVTLIRRPERRFVLRLSSLLTSLFSLDYFGEKACLAQSPQLHKQIMVGLIHSHRDLMEYLRRLLLFMINRAREITQDWPEPMPVPWPLMADSIPVLDFQFAKGLCAQGGVPKGEKDLISAVERYLGKWALEEKQSDFLFVEGYPMAVRPFYTMADEDNPARIMSFDLLFGGQELITGGQRLFPETASVCSRDARQGIIRFLQKMDCPPEIADVRAFADFVNRAKG